MGDSNRGRLVVCATPIGNLGDASPRLAEALADADLIACEDTRQTRKLLAHLGVSARLVSYHDANEAARAGQLAGEIAGGARVALVSDAGMPAVSDPGHDLIGACLERGLPVEVVPGPSAVLAALVVSGLPTDRFSFEGFPSRKPSARAGGLEELAGERRTMVFFEAPHRVLATLEAMAAAFGPERRCAVTRELTKLHEQVLRGTLAEVRDRLAEQGPRGEFTLVVAGAPEAPDAALVDVVGAVAGLVAAGASTRDAVAEVARRSSRPRHAVYQAVLTAREGARGTSRDDARDTSRDKLRDNTREKPPEFASLPRQDTKDSQDTRAAGKGRPGAGRRDDQGRSQERLR
jgi:16S rRNA (cytidine1402-2'-O)-methyltransferase